MQHKNKKLIKGNKKAHGQRQKVKKIMELNKTKSIQYEIANSWHKKKWGGRSVKEMISILKNLGILV